MLVLVMRYVALCHCPQNVTELVELRLALGTSHELAVYTYLLFGSLEFRTSSYRHSQT